MSESNYRKLDVWLKARELAIEIYRATRNYPREETYGLVQQMRRAAISILSNFAEGQGRWTRPDYRRFVLNARGSAFELEAQIAISEDLEFLQHNRAQRLLDDVAEVERLLNGVLEHIESQMQ